MRRKSVGLVHAATTLTFSTPRSLTHSNLNTRKLQTHPSQIHPINNEVSTHLTLLNPRKECRFHPKEHTVSFDQMDWERTSHLGDGTGDDGDRKSGRRVVQLHGPRPSPLSVNKESRKIGKPPLPGPSYQPRGAPPPANREPVIIYDVSPKVIHTEPSDFMSVVQRLTGVSSSSVSSARHNSPALELTGMGQTPGILPPAPANLLDMPSAMFFQAIDMQTEFGFQDNLMSPLYGHYFLQSPNSSALFSGTTMSSPSQFDISKLFNP